MPVSAQNLYFHLNVRADDDGFVDSPRKVMKIVGAADDDLKILLAKRYLLIFDSGIIVIKHWRLHNTIQKDRYKPTLYKEEMNQLQIKHNGAYTDNITIKEPDTECIQNVSKMDAQIRSDKDRLDQNRLDIDKIRDTESDGGALIEALRQAWNAEGLPKYTMPVLNMRPYIVADILRTLGGFGNDRGILCKAVKNYAGIRASPSHDPFPKDYGFEGFLKSGVINYVDDADPWTRFKKGTPEDKDAAYKKQVLDKVLGRV